MPKKRRGARVSAVIACGEPPRSVAVLGAAALFRLAAFEAIRAKRTNWAVEQELRVMLDAARVEDP